MPSNVSISQAEVGQGHFKPLGIYYRNLLLMHFNVVVIVLENQWESQQSIVLFVRTSFLFPAFWNYWPAQRFLHQGSCRSAKLNDKQGLPAAASSSRNRGWFHNFAHFGSIKSEILLLRRVPYTAHLTWQCSCFLHMENPMKAKWLRWWASYPMVLCNE